MFQLESWELGAMLPLNMLQQVSPLFVFLRLCLIPGKFKGKKIKGKSRRKAILETRQYMIK